MTVTPGRTSELTDLRVVVHPDAPKEVSLVSPVGQPRVLVIRHPGQTSESAVERILEQFPREHLDDVRRFVRKHLPDAPSLDTFLTSTAPKESWLAPPSDEPVKSRVSKRAWFVSAVGVTALVAATLVGYSLVRDSVPSMFDHYDFQRLAQSAHMDCTEIDASTAKCRTPSGGEWKVTATRAPEPGEPDAFRFSQGSQLAVLMVFETLKEREEYPLNQAYRRLWPYITSKDRVTIGSTDAPVLASLAGLVDDSVLAELPKARGDEKRATHAVTPPAKQTKTTSPWMQAPSPTPTRPWPTTVKPAPAPTATATKSPTGTPSPSVSMSEPETTETSDTPGTVDPTTSTAPHPGGGGALEADVRITIPLSGL